MGAFLYARSSDGKHDEIVGHNGFVGLQSGVAANRFTSAVIVESHRGFSCKCFLTANRQLDDNQHVNVVVGMAGSTTDEDRGTC